MIKKAIIDITLGIRGPILCKATAPSSWGLDASFDRNFEGKPFIDRSHIKGKLCEALNELGVTKEKTNAWLGKEGEFETARLMIFDFFFEDEAAGNLLENRLIRIRMDRARGVVDETALLFMETAFPLRDEPYEWKGHIEFFAKDDTEAKDIYKEVSAGLKWISAFGPEKSVGFGKLVSVVATLKEPLEDLSIPSPFPAPEKKSEWISITIEPKEPLLMGGVKPKANYMETEKIISGALIKGTLAETLNLICGHPVPSRIPIGDNNHKVKNLYPNLVKYFNRIRFTHAFPTIDATRPVVIPYSAVAASSGEHYDVALCEKGKTINGEAAKFQLDWKDDEFPDGFGWASPRLLFKTRTGIDGGSRRAKENEMFTYQYACPVDKDDNKVVWRGQAWIPDLAFRLNS